MTMDRSLIDPEQQVAAWDTIMAAQAPSYDPIQYTSSVESVPANIDIPQQEYVPDAADIYSYASPAPEYQPTYTPGPSLADVTAQEYEQYSAPDFSYQPEQGGSYYSAGTPFDASPVVQYDPSIYQQFGYGGTGEGGLTDQQAADLMFGRTQPEEFFQNPQYAESNAQFDYTTDPANRNGVGILGGLTNVIGAGLTAGTEAASALRALPMTYSVPGAPGQAITTQGNVGQGIDALDLPSDYAAQQTVNLLGDNPYGRTAAAGVNALLDPLTIAGGAVGGAGLAANLVGRGELGLLPYAASSFGAGAASQGAAELGASPGVQMLAGALGGVGGAVAPGLIADAARGLPRGSYGAILGPTGSEDDAARQVMRDLEAVTKAQAEDVAGDVALQSDEFAGNIRLSKFPEEARPAIADWAAQNIDEVQAARRGVIPDAQVQQMARQLVEDTGGNFDKLMKSWKPGDAWNAEETLAIRGVLASKAEAVAQAAKAAQLDDSALNQARLMEALTDAAQTQQIVHGVGAEAGRALRVHRQMVQALEMSEDAAAVRKALDVAGMDQGKIADIAKALTSGTLETPAQVNTFIRNVTKPGLKDYIFELWINALLSNPKTHVVNSLSSIANLSAAAERGVAAALDVPLAWGAGRPRARFFEEVPASIAGYAQGLPEGARAALNVLKSGDAIADATKIELRQTAFKGPLGRAIRAPSTMLEAADSFWYSIHYRGELNTLLVRKAKSEGLKGDALINRIADLKMNPPDDIVKKASEMANYRLFRNDPGGFAKWLIQGTNKFPPLKVVLPFVRTPTNILKYGLARSPAGMLNPGLWKNAAAGSPEAADQMARVLLGTGVAAAVAYAVAEGNITGAVPQNAAERDRFFREGKLPFAVNIGGTWVQYQRLEPFNQTLSQIAATVNSAKSGKSIDKVASEIVTNIGVNLVNQSYLTGISNLLNALSDPERYGENWLSRTATGFVPASSALRFAAQATDAKVRSPEGLAESIKAGIPGLSSSVPARLDAFGNEIERTTPAWSPIQIAPDRQTAVDAELDRLDVEVGFVGDTISGVELSREQKREFQKAAGQLTYQMLDAIMQASVWQVLDDAEKAKVVDRTIDAARDIYRDPIGKLVESEDWEKLSPTQRKMVIDAALKRDPQEMLQLVGQ